MSSGLNGNSLGDEKAEGLTNHATCLTDDQRLNVCQLLAQIERLSDLEKLYLYVQLPGASTTGAPLKGSNPRGASGGSSSSSGPPPNEATKGQTAADQLEMLARRPDQETARSYAWIWSHLELDASVSLPKQEVYDDYRAFCLTNQLEPLSVADFGKAMKYAFPSIKPRRLGQRGRSRYCYSGLRKRFKVQPPSLPEFVIEPTFCMVNDCSQSVNMILRDCQNNPDECPLGKPCKIALPDEQQVMNLSIEAANFQERSKHAESQLHCSTRSPKSSLSLIDEEPVKFVNEQQLEVALLSKQVNNQRTFPDTNQPNEAPQEANKLQSLARSGTPDDDDYRHNYYHEFLAASQTVKAVWPVKQQNGDQLVLANHHHLAIQQSVNQQLMQRRQPEHLLTYQQQQQQQQQPMAQQFGNQPNERQLNLDQQKLEHQPELATLEPPGKRFHHSTEISRDGSRVASPGIISEARSSCSSSTSLLENQFQQMASQSVIHQITEHANPHSKVYNYYSNDGIWYPD